MARAWDGSKPLTRGYIHRASFFLYIALAAVLLWRARAGLPRYALALYLSSLLNLYGISSVLHLTPWASEAAEDRLTRVDHASIFLLIAGTYSPICLVCVPEHATWGLWLLGAVWTIAILGVVKCMVWRTCPRYANVAFYFTCGLTIVPFFDSVMATVEKKELFYFVAGGALYLLGGLIYGSRFPDPSPAYFGFHEIFHLLTVLANLCFLHPMLSCVLA